MLVLLVGGAMMGTAESGQGQRSLALWEVIVTAIVGVCLMAQPMLGLTGSALCLFVPERGRMRLLLIVSLVLDIAGVGLAFVDLTPYIPEWLATLPSVSGVIAGAFALVSWVFFMNFLNQLAYYLEERDAAHEAILLIRWGVALILLPPLVLTGLGCLSGGENPPCVVSFVALVWLLFAVRWLVGYIGLLGILRESLDQLRRESDDT